MIIELKEISKSYRLGSNQVPVLMNVDFQVENGEFTAIMGPSGSGKSTLMNILGCLDRPSGGSYRLGGQEVAHLSNDELAMIRNQQIGFVFQSFYLLPRMSAVQNVALPLVYAGVEKRERMKRAEAALALVGLTGRLEHRPNEMSGGQRQRVAIARALVNNPTMIMADEPTGNLDTKSGQEVMAILQELNQQGRTILVVTHEPDIAEQTKRIVFVRDGRVIKDDRRKEA